MKKQVLFFAVLYCYACNENSVTTQQPNNISNDTTRIVTAPRDTGIYSIMLTDSITLSLQQWDSTIDLQRYLGKPVKEKSRELDRNSDTFSGSSIKDVEWNGLKLRLFSPPQNGKTFWIQEIILTNNKYKTPRNVTIGDSWQKVKQSYSSLQKFPGENENMYYVSDEGYERSIEMEFQQNKLQKLRMYYTVN